MSKLLVGTIVAITVIAATLLLTGEKADPVKDMIAHTDDAITAFQDRNYEKFFLERNLGRSAYLEHGLYQTKFPPRTLASVRAGRCDDSALNNYYKLADDLLSPLARAFGSGSVDTDHFEFDAERLFLVLQKHRSEGSEFSLSDSDERRIEQSCDSYFAGYSKRRRAFDSYVSENIENWVKQFGEIAGVDVVEEAERAASLRSLRLRLEDPNAWAALSVDEKLYHHGGDADLQDCIEATVVGGAPAGVSTSEITSLCRAGLK